MNVERWIRSRKTSWDQLEEILYRIEKQGIRGLDSQQLKGLGRLYRAASADLSRARALKMGGDVPVYLNNLVVKAHNQVYQRRVNRWLDFWNFLWITFPSLVQENILYIGLAFSIFAIPMVGSYLMVLHDLNFAHLELSKGEALVPEPMWHLIEQQHMWTDSVQDLSPGMSSLIATNNIRVAIMAFVLGITCGVGTTFVLFTNGLMTGTIFGVCRMYHMDNQLLAFVASHGVIELLSIFISGGAGLILAKALVFPGQWKRRDALRLESKRALALFGGCIPLLLIAGSIEGFISPRTDVSAETKYMVSIATMVCLIFYLFIPRSKRKVRD